MGLKQVVHILRDARGISTVLSHTLPKGEQEVCTVLVLEQKVDLINEDEGVLRFARKFKGMGIEDELEKMGAKPGDEVQILDYMFTFKG